MEFLDAEEGFRSIAVTSTIPGEGKTFIAINLAAIIAMQGKRVLLVDVDLRKPRIHKIFDLPNSAGMSTLLNKRSVKEDVTFSTSEENLWAIPAGPIPPNPSELIGGEHFVKFLNEVKTSFDVVIFDTPPIGLVTDSIPQLAGLIILSMYLGRITRIVLLLVILNPPKKIFRYPTCQSS